MNRDRQFSIIIPTYNRPQRLQACLQSLSRLNYPRDRFEVVVVDDGSETPLAEVIAPFETQFKLTLLRQANAGPAQARNTGAAFAQGQYLAFTDDDCAPLPDWLTVLETCFASAPDCVIGGQVLNALPNNPYATASQALTDYLYGYYNVNPDQAQFFTSNNFALAADHFHKVGGFDIAYCRPAGEDREFCDRLLNKGYRLLYVPAAQVCHAHPLTWRSFWRQQFLYGCGAFQFRQVCSQQTQSAIQVEPGWFYLKLLSYPFGLRSQQPTVLLVLLFVWSQIAITAGFVWQWRHQA